MAVMKLEVKRVLVRTDGVKYCVIPKNCSIKAGSLILITDNMGLINKFKEAENER